MPEDFLPENFLPQQLLRETALRSRRRFLLGTGGAVLSGATLALVAGMPGRALAGTPAHAGDVQILNTAIAAEHEAVAAYQLGAKSGLLSADVGKVAVAFQGHHKEHVEALAKAVRALGSEPVGPKREYVFPVAKLKTQKDVLEFAAGLERGAMSAYAGAIPLFADRSLSGAAASILADEAMHWAVLRNVLGLDPVPGAFFG